MFNVLKNILHADYNIFSFINGGWLFIYLGPLCLAIESAITYWYCKYKRKYESIQKKRKALRTYWKIIWCKLAAMAFLFWLLRFENGRIEFELPVPALFVYYAYTLGVAILFLIYLVKKYVRCHGNFDMNHEIDEQKTETPGG